MHYGPSEDMDVFVLVDAKVPVFRTSIWYLENKVFVYDFKQLLLDPVDEVGMVL